MQQFKRADPERLKHASGGCSPEAALEEKVPKGPPDEMVAWNGRRGIFYLPNQIPSNFPEVLAGSRGPRLAPGRALGRPSLLSCIRPENRGSLGIVLTWLL